MAKRATKHFTLPGMSYDSDGAFVAPLQAIGGSLVAAAATANQALTAAAGAALRGFITNITMICRVTNAVACSVELRDASSGTVLHKLDLAAAPAANAVFSFDFPVPHRTGADNGQFFITTTGALVTWDITCNGYISSVENQLDTVR